MSQVFIAPVLHITAARWEMKPSAVAKQGAPIHDRNSASRKIPDQQFKRSQYLVLVKGTRCNQSTWNPDELDLQWILTDDVPDSYLEPTLIADFCLLLHFTSSVPSTLRRRSLCTESAASFECSREPTEWRSSSHKTQVAKSLEAARVIY